MRLSPLLYLVAAVGVAEAAPKLVKVTHESGASVMAPKGWTTDIASGGASSRSTDGRASVEVTLGSENADAEVGAFFSPESAATSKKIKGWRCAEGPLDGEGAGYGGACAKQGKDGVTLRLSMRADGQKLWKQLGGLPTVQRMAASAKGFVATAGTKVQAGGPITSADFTGTTGAVACDAYIMSYVKCIEVTTIMDAPTKQEQLKAMKQAWDSFAQMQQQSPEVKQQLEDACKQAGAAIQDALKAMGCTP